MTKRKQATKKTGESYEDRIRRCYPAGPLRDKVLATYRRMSAIYREREVHASGR